MPKEKILVVDDEAIVRESIRDWLSQSDYDVSIAEDGQEALAKIKEQDFNVMLLDIRLPGESGVNVLAKAKSIRPKLKTIIITAYPTEDTLIESKKLGAIDYLIKPLKPEDLERLIRDTIDSMNKEAPVQEEMISTGTAPPLSKLYSITTGGLKSLIEGLIKEREVIGVKY